MYPPLSIGVTSIPVKQMIIRIPICGICYSPIWNCLLETLLTVGFFNQAMLACVLMFLRTNSIRNDNMYSGVESALIPYCLHKEDAEWMFQRRRVYACHSVEKWADMKWQLRLYLSSIQSHDLPKINYANLTSAFYCQLIKESNDM